MAAHVRRINSQDKIATGILTAIVGLVLLILAAIVIYIWSQARASSSM